MHMLFMLFEPVAHPLLPVVVVAIVSLFFPTVLEAIPSGWSIYIMHSPKCPPAISNSTNKLLQLVANIATARATR